jgi:hypothetical protein
VADEVREISTVLEELRADEKPPVESVQPAHEPAADKPPPAQVEAVSPPASRNT